IYLELNPKESLVVETFNGEYTGDMYRYYRPSDTHEVVALDSGWTLTFAQGGPVLPDTVKEARLGSWTDYGPSYAAFSGTAEYTIRIPALPQEVDTWRLDLGDVAESAAIYLNGNPIGTLIGPPYTIDIAADQFH